jgi:hypothetical protein
VVSALDELIEAVKERADEYTWPLLIVEKATAELAALRERIAKMDAALAKADELEVAAADVGHCLGCVKSSGCDTHSLYNPRLAYRIAREATK